MFYVFYRLWHLALAGLLVLGGLLASLVFLCRCGDSGLDVCLMVVVWRLVVWWYTVLVAYRL